MQKIIATFLFAILCIFVSAQSSVHYDVEPAITKIQNDYVAKWGQIGKIDGYRIQILAVTGTNSKGQAESAKAIFEGQFPEIPAYITYVEPYFRIRIGNFYSRLEAYKTLLEIQWQYPNAYIIPDKIDYSDN
ncbi:MAG: SPOR domain-containing protein [Bacteroidales bacterium]|nr:SPOR domain-containing protein [Bacteroidales bacterium]